MKTEKIYLILFFLKLWLKPMEFYFLFEWAKAHPIEFLRIFLFSNSKINIKEMYGINRDSS
ncbi:hypothetical protein BBH99_04085 [Chryseobacterium contaminans]|uniref:Uncharacterized protein n=1 Tax=Chryseobacterium contaminans TaxID=1423959 RepID=A0A1M7A001_9FLAO|nr:hypothetical protein BBH99_04085 [Chryseobacterium contaminans]SHL36034.1 hypothetical protein SAMN05444407_103431 [Chryseobacterium contaminans]